MRDTLAGLEPVASNLKGDVGDMGWRLLAGSKPVLLVGDVPRSLVDVLIRRGPVSAELHPSAPPHLVVTTEPLLEDLRRRLPQGTVVAHLGGPGALTAAISRGRILKISVDPSDAARGRQGLARGWRHAVRSLRSRSPLLTAGLSAIDGPLVLPAEFGTAGSWTYTDDGDYRTNKVLIRTETDGGPAIIKMVRDARDNARIDREWRGLQAAHAAGGLAVPAPVAVGEYEGRAFVVQSSVTGKSLRTVARHHPDPLGVLERGRDAFIDLARRTAHEPSEPFAPALTGLVDRYVELFAPGSVVENRLRDDVSVVADHDIPAVLQHGDAGCWNLLDDGAGRVWLLDWEASDPDGLPFWDLAYYVRSCVRVLYPTRSTAVVDAYTEQVLDPSGGLHDWQAGAFEALIDALDVAPQVVAPLVRLSWVYRAIKQVSRRPSDRLAGGTYHTLAQTTVLSPTPLLSRGGA